MSQFTSLSDILVANSHIILSLGEVASFIERKYAKVIKPYAKGIYKIGERYPSVVSDVTYFVKDTQDHNKVEQLTDISSLTDTSYIVDENNSVVIDNFYIKNRDSALSMSPSLPIHGYEIAKQAIAHYIGKRNPYTRDASTALNHISKLLIDGIDHQDAITFILDECVFTPVYMQIDSFIGKDIYHVYFYKTVSICDLVIEKTIDWRAYQWHLTQQDQDSEHHYP